MVDIIYRHYFIVYAWRRIGDQEWNISEQCIEGSPLDWLISMRTTDRGDISYIEYHLINWMGLSQEEYQKYSHKFHTYKQSIQERNRGLRIEYEQGLRIG